MRKLGHILSLIIATLWRYLPWNFNKYLGQIFAFLWLDVLTIRKKVIFENLETAFGPLNNEIKTEIARKSMQSLSRSFFDVIKIPYLNQKWIDQNVIFDGLEHIHNYKKNTDKGLLFLTLHLGSGDLGAAVISHSIIPCSLITKRFRNPFLDQFWFSLRGRSKTEFIDAHSQRNAFDILSALKRKRGVIFVLDQFMGKPYGVLTRFFNKETGTAYGLALFAKKTQLPVMPIYTYWDNANKLRICFGELIDLSSELSETNEVITQKFNSVLEKIIIQHPNHWMWIHRRWKTFE